MTHYDEPDGRGPSNAEVFDFLSEQCAKRRKFGTSAEEISAWLDRECPTWIEKWAEEIARCMQRVFAGQPVATPAVTEAWPEDWPPGMEST